MATITSTTCVCVSRKFCRWTDKPLHFLARTRIGVVRYSSNHYHRWLYNRPNQKNKVYSTSAALVKGINQSYRPTSVCHLWTRSASTDSITKNNLPPASASDNSKQVDDGLVSFTIPEPPRAPETAVEGGALPETVQEIVLNALGEPSFTSLGLASMWPPGRAQWFLENVHVMTELPWWATICVCTVVLRIALFPVVVKLRRNAVHMGLHSPKMAEFQEKISKARRRGDNMESAMITADMSEYMKKHNIRPFRNLLLPLMQAPFFISMFIGLRKMSTLPVESMREGGILWFTDLTLPDPYYALPILTCATLLLVLEVGSETGLKSRDMGNVKIFMRALPVVFLPFTFYFSSAILVYWFANNSMSLLQTVSLKAPAVRKALNLPDSVLQPRTDFSAKGQKKLGFVASIKEGMANARAVSDVEYRDACARKLFQEAGMGPIQKTYLHDPTKTNKADKMAATNKDGGRHDTSHKVKTSGGGTGGIIRLKERQRRK